jgi:hypothetical protein
LNRFLEPERKVELLSWLHLVFFFRYLDLVVSLTTAEDLWSYHHLGNGNPPLLGLGPLFSLISAARIEFWERAALTNVQRNFPIYVKMIYSKEKDFWPTHEHHSYVQSRNDDHKL